MLKHSKIPKCGRTKRFPIHGKTSQENRTIRSRGRGRGRDTETSCAIEKFLSPATHPSAPVIGSEAKIAKPSPPTGSPPCQPGAGRWLAASAPSCGFAATVHSEEIQHTGCWFLRHTLSGLRQPAAPAGTKAYA